MHGTGNRPRGRQNQGTSSRLVTAGALALIAAVFVVALLSASAGSAIGVTAQVAAILLSIRPGGSGRL